MNRIFSLIFILLSISLLSPADDKVTGEYTYRCGLDKSPEEAKRIALERAKIDALAAKYGTTMSQNNFTNIKTDSEATNIDFESISSSEVKGEWLETIGDPVYDIRLDGDMLSVTAKVTGKAREIVRANVDFMAKLLNSPDNRKEVAEYAEGESMFLEFESPTKGFLSCYLLADDGMAYCILPYINSEESIFKVDKDKDYIFFSPAHSATPAIVDEYNLTADKDIEHNQLYVIFSPNNFSKARDTSQGEGLPRGLSITDFQKWLSRQRSSDKQMQVTIKSFTIIKR
ncbi:MAG: DUF4384 domain-containing protein [Bacteroidales bacterium]|nr:DUF4384 domain-containing protein [Bacteroidales bacterium]